MSPPSSLCIPILLIGVINTVSSTNSQHSPIVATEKKIDSAPAKPSTPPYPALVRSFLEHYAHLWAPLYNKKWKRQSQTLLSRPHWHAKDPWHKLKHMKFHLNVRILFFLPMGVVRHSPGKQVLQGTCTRGAPEVPSKLNHSVSLWQHLARMSDF